MGPVQRAGPLAVNATVPALHAPFVADLSGVDRPWTLLAERQPDLRVHELAMGAGYTAVGRRPG